MSEQNVQIVEGMYGAFAKGDIPAVLAALDPEVEWWAAENFIYDKGKPYVGPESVLKDVFMRIGSDWDGFASSPEEVLDAGDAVISHGYYSGTYRKNGKQARAQFAHIFTLRDGKIVKFQQYTDTAQFKEVIAG
jgi:ketosteroid isomerase-like protein